MFQIIIRSDQFKCCLIKELKIRNGKGPIFSDRRKSGRTNRSVESDVTKIRNSELTKKEYIPLVHTGGFRGEILKIIRIFA